MFHVERGGGDEIFFAKMQKRGPAPVSVVTWQLLRVK